MEISNQYEADMKKLKKVA